MPNKDFKLDSRIQDLLVYLSFIIFMILDKEVGDYYIPRNGKNRSISLKNEFVSSRV